MFTVNTIAFSGSQLSLLEASSVKLGERLWELSPPIDTADTELTLLASTLPYFQYAREAEHLPTCFARTRQAGMFEQNHNNKNKINLRKASSF
jgi:hypothetical protein